MLKAGCSITEITPWKGVEMAGYPHCPRPNEGVHDPLYASALYLYDGEHKVVWVTLDILYYGKVFTKEMKEKFPDYKLLMTTTHTHSGPWAATPEAYEIEEGVANDEKYIAYLQEKLEALIKEAIASPFDAEIGFAFGRCGAEQGVGGNRRDPKGLSDPEVCTLSVRDADRKLRAILVSYALHPTYLHAENLLVTADYPGSIRRYLKYAAPGAIFMFAQGTSGNQSSRYFRTGQNFEESCRVGTTIGVEVFRCLEKTEYSSDVDLSFASAEIELPMREYPPVEVSYREMEEARRIFRETDDSDYIKKRNAELTMFGTESNYANSKYIAEHGSLNNAELPLEVGVLKIGSTVVFYLQGEIFVEYGLRLKEEAKRRGLKAFVVEVTNGAAPGYFYTPESLAEGGYEVGNSSFAPECGDIITSKLISLLDEVK